MPDPAVAAPVAAAVAATQTGDDNGRQTVARPESQTSTLLDFIGEDTFTVAMVDVGATSSMRDKRDRLPSNGTARHKVTQGVPIDDAQGKVRRPAHMDKANGEAKRKGAEAAARMRREAAAHAANGQNTSAAASNPVHHGDAFESDVIVVAGDDHRSQTRWAAALDACPASRGTASMRTKKMALNKTPSHVATMMKEAVAALRRAKDTAPQRTTPKDPDSDEDDELLRRARRRRSGSASSYSSAPSLPTHRRQRAVNRRRVPTRTIYGSSSSSSEVAAGIEDIDDPDNDRDEISGSGSE